MKLTIGTLNINSIRIRINQLFIALKDYDIDILFLQETKCQDIHFPLVDINSFGYNAYFVGQKSYNGVAIISKFPINIESKSLFDNIEINKEARYIDGYLTINNKCIKIASVYVPNGQDPNQLILIESSEKFIKKLSFYDKLIEKANFYKDDFFICGGDFNVAKDEIDLWNPKANKEKVGFHSLEREKLKKFESCNMIDLYRYLNSEKQEYSWWDYRTKAFDKNLGWRIDYLFASKTLLPYVKSCNIIKEYRGKEKPSDHTIVLTEFDL